MEIMGLDINTIVDLGTQVASSGTLRVTDFFADELFEYTVGVAVMIYEMYPPMPGG